MRLDEPWLRLKAEAREFGWHLWKSFDPSKGLLTSGSSAPCSLGGPEINDLVGGKRPKGILQASAL